MVKNGIKEEEGVPIIADLSTGLQNQRTKPRRIPDGYLKQTVKDVISYLERTIEKKGDMKEASLIANIHDQMVGQYVIQANEKNVNPDAVFETVIQQVTKVEDIGESGEHMPVRTISFVITKVEKGGICCPAHMCID